VEARPDGVIVQMTRDAAMEFAIEAGLGDGSAPPLYCEEHAFAGYSWYDELTVVRPMIEIVQDGKTTYWELLADEDVSELLSSERDPNHCYVESINLRLHDAKSGDDLHGASLPFIVLGEASEPDEVHLVTQKGSKIDRFALAAMMEAAFFQASDDADADSYETQLRNWQADAEHRAVAIMDGADAADIHAIEQAVWKHCMWLMRTDSIAKITIDQTNRAVSVSIEPAPAAA
jgi:hypothetical protein